MVALSVAEFAAAATAETALAELPTESVRIDVTRPLPEPINSARFVSPDGVAQSSVFDVLSAQ